MATLSKADRLKALKARVKKYKTKASKAGMEDVDHILHFGIEDYPRIPSGIAVVDKLLGGGFPGGKITTIAGPSQTAKGTLAARAVAHNQTSLDGNALWIDAEEALDKEWMQKQGVNTDELFLIEKDTMENMLDQAIDIVRERLVTIVVLDSIGALMPRAEQESKEGAKRSLTDDTIGMLQRKMGQFLRLICAPAAKSHAAVIMLGQIYMDVNSYGGLELVKGGNAVKHFTHVRLMTRRGPKAQAPVEKVDGKDKLVGFQSCIKLGKTRQSGTLAEGSEVTCPFRFGTGFDDLGYLMDQAIIDGKIVVNGAWYSLEGERIAQGKVAARQYFIDNPEKVEQIK